MARLAPAVQDKLVMQETRKSAAKHAARCALIAACLGAFAACSSAKASGQNEVTVFAAASLTDAFTVIAEEFHAANPSRTVKLSFAGSQSLRTQISHGAPAHVFASANENHIESLRSSGLAGEPAVFAHNELVIAVPAGNPAGIHSLEDLPKAKRLVLAGDAVPAGAYAAQVLQNADSHYGAGFAKRVAARVVSREMHVRQTLQKVVLGEADACIVYATDAAAAGDAVETIVIPTELNVRAAYPIVTVGAGADSEAARAFVAFVQSDVGQAALAKHGFGPAVDERGGQ